MIGLTAGNTEGRYFTPDFYIKILHTVRKVIRALVSFKPKDLLSEDIRYNIYFRRSFIPELYSRHTASKKANCLFCSNLTKSVYNRYCLICSKGTYDNCYLPLPDILYEGFASPESNNVMLKPWYFMKTCSCFERLPERQYSRNLRFPFSSITIHNQEALEGLENGLLSGSRPCYICASVDYDVYKRCRRQGDFDISSPCPCIKRELDYTYENRRSAIRPAG